MAEARAPRRRPVLAPSIATLAVLAVLVVLLAACGSGPGPAPTGGSPAGSDGIAARGSGAPSGSPPSTADPATSDTAGPTADSIVVDPGLLALLPARIGDVPLNPAPDTAAGMIQDASLASVASAVAVAMAVSPRGSSDVDFAVASVVALRPGVYTDDFYAGWRSAYDKAACDPAGGVGSHVQRVIGAHRVEVTLCQGGARTYHVHLDGDILVSVTAVGEGDLGGLVLAGLRE